jgi:hypothetical protein
MAGLYLRKRVADARGFETLALVNNTALQKRKLQQALSL